MKKKNNEPIELDSKQAYSASQKIGDNVTAGALFEKGKTYSLKEVLIKLSERAHKHDQATKVINNCNCQCPNGPGVNCNCQCCDDCHSSH